MGVCLALSHMEGRFSIRGSVSPPMRSTTGFAEGRSVSVVGMVGANSLMQHRAPNARLMSCADNLELCAHEPHTLMQSTTQPEAILEVLDLEVDKKQTYLWSTEGTFRKVFLLQQEMLEHMSNTHDKPPTLPSLKRLKASGTDTENSTAGAVAWPNMLHGIASVYLGDPWYEDMRTGAMRAIGEHKRGCPARRLSISALWNTPAQITDSMLCGPPFANADNCSHWISVDPNLRTLLHPTRSDQKLGLVPLSCIGCPKSF